MARAWQILGMYIAEQLTACKKGNEPWLGAKVAPIGEPPFEGPLTRRQTKTRGSVCHSACVSFSQGSDFWSVSIVGVVSKL